MTRGLFVGIVALVAVSVALAASPQMEGVLTGTWFLGGPMVEDGTGAGSTHFYLSVDGEAARTLMEALDSPSTYDPCVESPSKSVGHIVCWEKPYGPRCRFAVDIEGQRIVQGSIC